MHAFDSHATLDGRCSVDVGARCTLQIRTFKKSMARLNHCPSVVLHQFKNVSMSKDSRLYWGYMGIMQKNMETTVMGYFVVSQNRRTPIQTPKKVPLILGNPHIGFRVWASKPPTLNPSKTQILRAVQT